MIIGLKPCDSEMMAYYRARVGEYIELADGIRTPAFSATLRADLLKILGDAESVQLVEALTRFKGFGKVERYRSLNSEVKKILNRKGIRLPAGKRPKHPGLEPMVESLAPVLLALGLPGTTSERSALVLALRAIALELGITGDPRDMLRRAAKMGHQEAQQTRRELLEAFARGIAPDPD